MLTITLAAADARPVFADSKTINRLVFGAWYEEDIYHQFCTRTDWDIAACAAVRGPGAVLIEGTCL